MATIYVYARETTLRTGRAPEEFKIPIFRYDPIDDDDAGSVRTLSDGKQVVMGRSYHYVVDVPGDNGVVDLGAGFKVMVDPMGDFVSADYVMARVHRGVPGYRIVSDSRG